MPSLPGLLSRVSARRPAGLLAVGMVLLASPHAALDEPSAGQQRVEQEVTAGTAATVQDATDRRARAAPARVAVPDRPAALKPAGRGRAPASRLALPTQGWLSSSFGSRFDPYYGVWQLHAGVDIAAPGGAPIHAAAAGTVLRAGWNGGYGNFTCLGHGRHHGQELASCYAHQSQILVRRGQGVRRGELIGRVGTTGASTGNHLHFEVRLDGSPTDPVQFLPPF